MPALELVATKQAGQLIKSFCYSVKSTKMLGLASLKDFRILSQTVRLG